MKDGGELDIYETQRASNPFPASGNIKRSGIIGGNGLVAADVNNVIPEFPPDFVDGIQHL